MTTKVSRRRLMQIGLGAAATAGLTSTGAVPLARAATTSNAGADSTRDGSGMCVRSSIDRAYKFLDFMMDEYVQGSTVRLCQSYSDQIAGGTFYSTAFIYDNAVLTLAYLAGGNVGRARVIGDGILFAQQNVSQGDGRFWQAYYAGVDNGGVYVAAGLSYFQGSAMGDVAWPGMALAQLYHRTGEKKYLDGAVLAGTFIKGYRDDSQTPGGFFYGNGQTYKSTEHNIDIYAFFTMLAELTGDSSWTNGALHAKAFVEFMFDSPSGHFWTGTNPDNSTNYNNSPEDVNTWSYLAYKNSTYGVSIDWVKTNLSTTDTSFAYNNSWGYGTQKIRVNGMTYASLSKLGTILGDPTSDADAVWLEGTGHLIAALLFRRLPADKDIPGFHGDLELAFALIENCQIAQDNLAGLAGTAVQTVNGTPIPTGTGLTASTSNLNTGFGFSYYPYLHIGATGWYVIGALGFNPMRLEQI